MRKLFFILSVILLASCSSESETPAAKLNNTDISIEKIVLNNQSYDVDAKNFMISGAPLMLDPLSSITPKEAKMTYVWNKTTEVLTSVSAECKNPTANVNVKMESTSREASDLWNKFTVTVVTTTPEAQVVYTIYAPKVTFPEKK